MPLPFWRFVLVPFLLTQFFPIYAFSQDQGIHDITLENAVIQAAKNNFDIRLERINVELAREERIVAESEFDPVIGSSLTSGKSRRANTSAFASPEIGENDWTKGDLTVSGIATPGTEYKVGLEASKTSTNSTFEGINPSYNASLKMEITQPLLRNAGTAVNKWRIITSANNEAIARSRLHVKLSETLTKVHETYWELLFRREDLKAQREGFDRAKDLENRVRVQVEVGSLAPIEIIQAQAFVAASDEKVIAAEHFLGQVGDRLLKLINPSSDEDIWRKRLNPSDRPEIKIDSPELEKSVKIALEKRPEILAKKKNIENEHIELVYRENQKWPSLDIIATLSLNGVRGKTRPITRFGGAGESESAFGGDWADVSSDVTSGDFYDYLIGLRISYPFGSRASRALAAKSELRIQARVLELKNLETETILEVRNAVRQIKTSKKQIAAARLARILAERKLDAEMGKFEVGASTSFNVLEFQKDLTIERSNELRALAMARKALARYHKAIGSTLEYNQIAPDLPR